MSTHRWIRTRPKRGQGYSTSTFKANVISIVVYKSKHFGGWVFYCPFEGLYGDGVPLRITKTINYEGFIGRVARWKRGHVEHHMLVWKTRREAERGAVQQLLANVNAVRRVLLAAQEGLR